MNPLVLAALGVGALVLLTGGGSKTAQPPLPREPDNGGGGGGGGGGGKPPRPDNGSGEPPRPDGGGGVVGGGGTPSGEGSGTYIARRLQRAVRWCCGPSRISIPAPPQRRVWSCPGTM